MDYKKEEEKNKKKEKVITISINGKDVDNIPLEDAIKKNRTIKDLVKLEIDKSPEIKAVEQFFVRVNGKNVPLKDAMRISIESVKTIEIFDRRDRQSDKK